MGKLKRLVEVANERGRTVDELLGMLADGDVKAHCLASLQLDAQWYAEADGKFVPIAPGRGLVPVGWIPFSGCEFVAIIGLADNESWRLLGDPARKVSPKGLTAKPTVIDPHKGGHPAWEGQTFKAVRARDGQPIGREDVYIDPAQIPRIKDGDASKETLVLIIGALCQLLAKNVEEFGSQDDPNAKAIARDLLLVDPLLCRSSHLETQLNEALAAITGSRRKPGPKPANGRVPANGRSNSRRKKSGN